MLIGLDAIPLTEQKTGVGHYTFELARALAAVSPPDEFRLVYPSSFAPLEDALGETAATPSNLRCVRIPVGALTRHWWAIGLPRHIRRARYALFHGTNFDVPLLAGCATVLTIHDLSLLLHTETHEARRVRRARRRLPLMARAATRIITPTESVRREVCAHLRGVGPEKVFVVPEAPRSLFRPVAAEEASGALRRLGIAGDFLLAVGTIEPRKNLSTLLRAFAEVVRQNPSRPLKLVIAGREGWLTGELFAELESAGIKERVRLTGYVSDEDLRALYSACRLFIYPSIYEGFGLPPLEAMACGAPVITSDIPSLSETTSGAARLVNTSNHQALASAIIELLDDEHARLQLSARGLCHARAFTWERAAEKTLEVYEDALRKR